MSNVLVFLWRKLLNYAKLKWIIYIIFSIFSICLNFYPECCWRFMVEVNIVQNKNILCSCICHTFPPHTCKKALMKFLYRVLKTNKYFGVLIIKHRSSLNTGKLMTRVTFIVSQYARNGSSSV